VSARHSYRRRRGMGEREARGRGDTACQADGGVAGNDESDVGLFAISRAHEGETTSLTPRLPNADKIVLMKLMNADDTEVFFTPFKRRMVLHHVEESHWVGKLAPQLTGHTQ